MPLAELLESVVRDRDFDAIVPVPMHRSKLRQRGYNQAELLGRSLARRLRIPVRAVDAAQAGRKGAQSKLARSDRAANVRGAFAASPRVEGRSLLIVDDICTTAETLRACVHALRSGNASRVCAVIVAKA
jgi:ComF family protein